MTEQFFALPVSTQRKIDEAFDAFANIGVGNLTDEAQVHSDLSSGKNAGMPLSAVRQALGFLNLPQDDEDTLAVLETAAKGWHVGPSKEKALDRTKGAFINREDWRAVCAVLMDESEDPETLEERQYETEDQKMGNVEDLQGGYIMEDDTHGGYITEDNDSDIYQNSDDMYDEIAEDVYSDTASEHSGQPSGSKLVLKGKKKQRVIDKPTSGQQQVALEAFALFFPSTDSETALKQKRLTVKDLDRVAKSLKEEMKPDEVSTTRLASVFFVEIHVGAQIKQMIEWFSTSPDKTLSFDDFTRIMLMAGLV